MQTVESLAQIIAIIKALQPGDWLVVDVDNTLIMPEDAIFQSNSQDKNFIDNIKKKNPPNLSTNLSKWRLKRKVKFVENGWSEALQMAHAKGVMVYGLTQMDTGTYGIIPSMEKWRAAELKTMDLVFTNYADTAVQVLLPGESPGTIYQGIMFTGRYTKAEVLAAFMAKHASKPKFLVFVDDRLEQVENIEKWCQDNQIAITSCHYTAAGKTEGNINPARSSLQIESFQNANWLSDAEADAVLTN